MEQIVVNGILYEAVDFNHIYNNFQQAINFLQDAKKSITDKNEKRTVKSAQTKIKKAFLKIKDIENSRYAAKFRPLTDEERMKNLHSIDAGLEQKATVSPNPKRNG